MTHPRLAPIYEIRQIQPNVDGKWRRLLTHIEIRRAQNGFIVMGFNAAPASSMNLTEDSRVCFVCETVESLCNTLASLATDTGDFAWTASIDLPLTAIFSDRSI
jgi:hypothetical protein